MGNIISTREIKIPRKLIPTDTRRNNNVIMTPKRRRNVVLTSKWRYFYVVCPLGSGDLANLIQSFLYGPIQGCRAHPAAIVNRY